MSKENWVILGTQRVPAAVNDSFLICPSVFPSATKGDHAAPERHLIIKHINYMYVEKSKQTWNRLIHT